MDIDPEYARVLARDLHTAALTVTPTPGAPPLPDPPLARFTGALAGALAAVATRTEGVHEHARSLAAASLGIVATAEDSDARLAHDLGRLM